MRDIFVFIYLTPYLYIHVPVRAPLQKTAVLGHILVTENTSQNTSEMLPLHRKILVKSKYL